MENKHKTADSSDILTIRPIGHIHTDFPEKFGIPRQSGLVPSLQAYITFEKEFQNPDCFRDIERFTHLWLIWGFSENQDKGWSPTVRPPRLGGNVHTGVFASRSPFRPNPLGLSSVRLKKVLLDDGSNGPGADKFGNIEAAGDLTDCGNKSSVETSGPVADSGNSDAAKTIVGPGDADFYSRPVGAEGPVLFISGADLMDGTPIYDIKPYVPLSDCHPDASASFTNTAREHRLTVHCEESLLAPVAPDKRQTLLDVLALDPRPAYHDDPERIYGMDFGNWCVRFCVDGMELDVKEIVRNKK